MKFTHLHNHTCIGSFLDAISTPKELIMRAKELNMDSISVNDHASINALPDMLKYGKEFGIKAIIGVEYYVVFRDDLNVNTKNESRYHLNVMAKNWNGVKKLFEKLTLANTQKYYRPRLFFDQILDFGDDVILSTACAISMLTRPDYDNIIQQLKETYQDSLFLEIIPVSFNIKDTRDKKEIKNNPIELIDQAKLVNLRVIELCEKYNVKSVCSMDTHFAYPEHRQAHEISLCVSTKDKIAKSRDERFYFDGAGIHDGNEVFKEFQKLGYISDDIIIKSIENSNIMADKCQEIIMPKFTINLPKAYEGDDDEIFKNKIKEGFKRLYSHKPNIDEYIKRIEYEVNVIKELNLVRYFLLVEDVMRFCRENDIPVGYARGSGGSSLVGSCLGITKRIDPVDTNLIFDRFLNRSRVSMADYDVDICSEKISIVLDYIYDKYGKDYVAPIGAFTELTPRNAFRDVCSVYNIDSKETNTLSKLIEEGIIKENGKSIGKYSKIEAFDYVPQLIEFKNKYPQIIETVKILNGRIRQATKHPCGTIISSVPLSEVGVIECRKNNEYCLNWDKDISEYTFKLLKLDLLKVSTVTIIDYACKLIKQNRNIDISMDTIPFDDKETEEMIAKGDTKLIFQFENDLSRKLLKDSNKGTLLNCCNVSSANRPGILGAIMEDGKSAAFHYIDRVAGREEITHFIPQYETLLNESCSIMLYQEQLMSITMAVAGFTTMKADNYRRLVAKKHSKEEFEKHRNDFVQSCIQHSNLEESKANAIFDSFLVCSSYLFAKSHGLAYAMLSFSSAYLKKHYSLEFYCANLTYSDGDKIPIYIQDAKEHNIQIKTPDINLSHATKYIIIEDYILAPLNSCKWVGDNISESIISIRNTPFIDMNDFNNRINQLPKRPNKRCLASLFYSNAFKSLNHFEKDPKKASEKMLEYLPIFSPLPYIDLTQNIERDFNQIKSIANTIKQCANEEYIYPIGKPSNVLCILEVGKNENQLMETYTWFKSELEKRLNTQICVISPSGCKDLCQNKCIDKLESFIQSIKPLLILNCSSKTSKLFGYKFGETFGNINYVEKFDCHLINIPSPAYMGFKKDIKEIYRNKIIPLLENYKVKENINEN